MTIEAFDAWVDEESHAEFMDGRVFLMSPVSGTHADLQAWLTSILSIMVRQGNLGIVRGPEFQMRFPAKRFEPDLLFVSTAHANKIHETFLDGPADMVIEIVSPESAGRDWHDKFAAYALGGVNEYWIIDPAAQRCECYQLSAGGYQPTPLSDGKLESKIIPRFYLRDDWLWSVTLPDPLAILEEFGIFRRAV